METGTQMLQKQANTHISQNKDPKLHKSVESLVQSFQLALRKQLMDANVLTRIP